MKLLSLLIGAAVGVAGGMYFQKKKDEKACPAPLKNYTEILTKSSEAKSDAAKAGEGFTKSG